MKENSTKYLHKSAAFNYYVCEYDYKVQKYTKVKSTYIKYVVGIPK